MPTEPTSESVSHSPTGVPTAPGWAVTDHPIRIAILGWARLSAQGREGSGYNQSASDLALGLSMSGHRVFYLRSGMEYSFKPGMFIREHEAWGGIACYRLFNSPNLSPAIYNFRNMPAEIASPGHTTKVLAWLDRVDAQVVHIHSLEGFSLDLIAAIRASGRPVVMTTHNYWPVCPQVDLLYKERHVCMDYRGGEACVGCLNPARPDRARLRRKIEQSASRWFGPRLGKWVHTTLMRLKGPLYEVRVGKKTRSKHPVEEPIPDPELALGFAVDDAETHDGLYDPGLPMLDVEIMPLGRSPLDQNERFLAADHHLRVLNTYGQRRVAGIEAMNNASLVAPPSAFMAKVYRAMGVQHDRVRQVRLGQPHFDRMNRRVRRSPYYDAQPWDATRDTRPLRFAFFGTVRHNKGVDVLVRAIPLLDKDIRQRCQFIVRAALGDWLHRRRLAAYPEVSFLGGYDIDQLFTAGGEYDVGILPHIWFENSPLVLLEFLHAGKFVVSSRLGGPAEWLVEPGTPDAQQNGGLGNGLFFPAGEPEDLAACITRIVRGEVILPSPRQVHAVSALWSYPDHVREWEQIYHQLLSRPGSTPCAAASHSADAVPTGKASSTPAVV